jgi:hypothetical protein
VLSTLLALVHLALVVWAIYTIAQSRAETLHKVLWALAVFFFPVVGLIVWYIAGPKR